MAFPWKAKQFMKKLFSSAYPTLFSRIFQKLMEGIPTLHVVLV